MSPVHCIFFGHVWRSDGESNKMQKEGGADDDGRRKRRGATGRVEIEEEGNLFIARGCLCGTDSK